MSAEGTPPPKARASCFDKAAELLARRPHFRSQLAAKLAARGYPDDEIAATLDRLAGHGWLDDHATARGYAAQQLARGPVGRRRLAAELGRRGAPSAAIDEVLAELPDDDLESAREAARRWARGRAAADPSRLARHLDRKGFSRRAIWAVLAEHGGEPPAEG